MIPQDLKDIYSIAQPSIFLALGGMSKAMLTRGDVTCWRGLAYEFNAATGFKVIECNASESSLSTELLRKQKSEPAVIFGDNFPVRLNSKFFICSIAETISDKYREGDSYYAAHDLTPEILNEAGDEFNQHHPDIGGPLIAVMLSYGLTYQSKLYADMVAHAVSDHPGATLYICGSWRVDEMQQNFFMNHLRCKLNEMGVAQDTQIIEYVFDRAQTSYNPYKGLIAKADHFFVDRESYSMISECLFSGKTVHVMGDTNFTDRSAEKYITVLSDNKPFPPIETKKFRPFNPTRGIAKKMLRDFWKHERRRLGKLDKKLDAISASPEWIPYLKALHVNRYCAERFPKDIHRDPEFRSAVHYVAPNAAQYLPT